MHIWIMLSLLLVGLAGTLYMLSRHDPTAPEAEKRFNEALETPQDEAWLNQRKWRQANRVTYRFKKALERTPGTDMQEIETLLRQAAFVGDQSRTVVYASLWVIPLLFASAASIWAIGEGQPLIPFLVFGFGFGFILPRHGLRWMAVRRQKAITEELPIVLNLMRMLFDSGLSLEHTLKAISEQARQITPHLANEFAWVLARIHQGQERGEALTEMAKRIDVAELTETVSLLKQAARYGGNIRDSLLRYIKLMEERRLNNLRDKVGKLSAKMSVVMMLFLFPSLLILLAGPSALALVRALKGM